MIFYLANEVTGIWLGMEIAVPTQDWTRLQADLSPHGLATEWVNIAHHAQLRHYPKHSRGPKKPAPKRRGTDPHVSTARPLATHNRR